VLTKLDFALDLQQELIGKIILANLFNSRARHICCDICNSRDYFFRWQLLLREFEAMLGLNTAKLKAFWLSHVRSHAPLTDDVVRHCDPASPPLSRRPPLTGAVKTLQVQGVLNSKGSFESKPGVQLDLHEAHHWFF